MMVGRNSGGTHVGTLEIVQPDRQEEFTVEQGFGKTTMTHRWSRRSVLKGIAGASAAVATGPWLLSRSAAAENVSVISVDTLDGSYIPPDMGQSSLQVFVPDTGHTVRGMMLDYWRANGAAAVYGNPISEPFVGPNGLYSQAFERGIFQYSPDWLNTEDPVIRLMPIGDYLINDRRLAQRADGRRSVSEASIQAFTPPSPDSKRASVVADLGGRFSDVTGFSIAGDFQTWYDDHEGGFYLGEPLSEPFSERGNVVQYYQNGVLLQTSNGATISSLPSDAGTRWGFDPAPIKQDDLSDYNEGDFMTADNPSGVDATQLAGRRSIVVSLSEQTMYVYEGGDTVLTSLISSGLAPNVTQPGNFHIRLKFPSQTMSGFTDETGEVTGFASDDSGGNGQIPWTVEDVPNVMYFSLSAEALHGAYWHNNFGNPMSHGCINQPLDVAAFMYGWAPLGTNVTITE